MLFVEVFKVVMYIVFSLILFVSSYFIIVLLFICYVVISRLVEYKFIIMRRCFKIYIVVLWLIFIVMCGILVISIFERVYMLIYFYIYVLFFVILLMVVYVKIFCVFVR